MRWRLAFAFTLMMALETGCPETWGREGLMDRAVAKDIEEELHRHNCNLTKEEWTISCRFPDEWGHSRCPHECQFRIAE